MIRSRNKTRERTSQSRRARRNPASQNPGTVYGGRNQLVLLARQKHDRFVDPAKGCLQSVVGEIR
jgi:hypothetical protein